MGKVFEALQRAKPSNCSPPVAGSEGSLWSSRREAGGSAELGAGPRNSLGWDERLLTLMQTPVVLESVRRLRSKILHPASGEPCRSLLVTGAEAGEGKSFLTANLGISFAQSLERHALLVDCDLRRCALAELFGLRHKRGLVNFLRDGVELASLLSPSGLPKLTILPSGPPPTNPAELLGSERMSALIGELKVRYADRLVVLDSPPTQAASETAVLAKQVDGVILVVRWGHTGREQVKKLVEAVGREKVVGLVFNGCEHNAVTALGQGRDYYREYKR